VKHPFLDRESVEQAIPEYIQFQNESKGQWARYGKSCMPFLYILKNLFWYQIMGQACVSRYGTAGALGMSYPFKGAGING
jgi:hypothetical protein